MTELKDLKNKYVPAEELYRLLYETGLTIEEKMVILCARLQGGSLPRGLAPKGRGLVEYQRGRSGLNNKRLAAASLRRQSECELFDDTYPLLNPEPKAKRTKPDGASNRKAAAAGAIGAAPAPKGDAPGSESGSVRTD